MARAKIIFLPQGVSQYLNVLDKYYKWTYDTSNIKEYGYILTNEESHISTINSSYWFRLVADSGYKIVRMYRTDSRGSSVGVEYGPNDMIYPWVAVNNALVNNYLYVEIEEEVSTPLYNLEQNLTNCTSNISGSTIEETEGKEIILTCNDGFIFDEVPTITIGRNTFEFNLNEDSTVATIIVDIIGDVVINAVAVKDVRVYITGNIVNATCNYSDGEFLKIGKNIIITANHGYTFKGSYSYTRGVRAYEFNNYETYLEIEIDENDLNYNFYLDDDYIATREIEQLGTFVNLYKTNQTELTELSKVRFYEELGQITDYGQFITSLYVLPFNIPSDILGDKSPILLGNFDSGVESTLITTYSFDIDGGEIEVPLKYNNIYDFINTECILHLPFLDKVYLNTEYVIGQKLTITFTIELYSGTLIANIKSSFNNEIVASVQGLIGMNIPFIQKSNGNVINSISNVYKNRIDRCFIEVNRNIPYTKDNNIFGGSVVEYGRIGDYTGYLECDKIVLETNATNQEQEEIKNLLRNGVFV